MPVLPLVGSRMMVSGPSLPAASAASIMLERDAVFDAAAGILKFELSKHLGPGALGDPAQAHERGVADQFGDVVGDMRHWRLLRDDVT